MNGSMVKAYLERLSCPDVLTVGKENLFRLQRAHLENIPYENITILSGLPDASLNLNTLFDRIVTKRRGGYCFELNGLFADLLRSLGYGVTEFFGRWHFGESNPVPMRRHRILKVLCGEGIFLVDAGVGCLCPIEPLEYRTDVVQKRNVRDYRIVRDSILGLVVQTQTEQGWVPFFSFSEDPHFPQDFEYVNFFCRFSPDSVFRKKLSVHRYTADGRINIEDRTTPDELRKLRETTPDGSFRERVIANKAELREILVTRFGLDYPMEELPD